ncbi:hypothetical protein [Geobacter sp.]|uniref:hypothetical protein n=1 Tax=Geobacter sp. TaxID=46610 RepID=UPI002616C502|nr:hypothetical protein [Geobacter sp.]
MYFIQLFLLLPMLLFVYQVYRYAITQTGIKKERACFALGITYFSVGVTCLVFRRLQLALLGLLLLMLGLLLIAHGLQRKDKKIFIDRFDEDL